MYFIVRDHHLKYSSKSQKDLDIRRQERVSQAENSKRNAKERSGKSRVPEGCSAHLGCLDGSQMVEVSFPLQVGSRPGRLTNF